MAIFKNYNYLDQLVDTEIDLTKYLENFSDTNYTLDFRNEQPVVATIKNLFEQINIVKDFRERGSSFFKYRIEEGQLPEDVSELVYGSIDYWWVICLFNDITNPLLQWPMDEDQMQYLITELISKENKYSRQTYYNLFFDMNESGRNIDILKNIHLADLIYQFRNNIVSNSITGTDTFTITL